jgi:mRNA-degrading endonuclease toxin of MazEF toxin-antitoxin module
MNQWDIYMFPFEEERLHPVVIISPDERAQNRRFLNGLLVTTIRGDARLNPTEVLLNSADGLEWESACRCDLIHRLEKGLFREKRGVVSYQRRREISRKLASVFKLLL